MSLFHLASGELRKENDRLELKIKQLKYERDKAIFVARDRLDRLNKANNTINELEKRCNEMLKLFDTFDDEERFNNWKEYKVYGIILDWVEELKGSDENE